MVISYDGGVFNMTCLYKRALQCFVIPSVVVLVASCGGNGTSGRNTTIQETGAYQTQLQRSLNTSGLTSADIGVTPLVKSTAVQAPISRQGASDLMALGISTLDDLGQMAIRMTSNTGSSLEQGLREFVPLFLADLESLSDPQFTDGGMEFGRKFCSEAGTVDLSVSDSAPISQPDRGDKFDQVFSACEEAQANGMSSVESGRIESDVIEFESADKAFGQNFVGYAVTTEDTAVVEGDIALVVDKTVTLEGTVLARQEGELESIFTVLYDDNFSVTTTMEDRSDSFTIPTVRMNLIGGVARGQLGSQAAVGISMLQSDQTQQGELDSITIETLDAQGNIGIFSPGAEQGALVLSAKGSTVSIDFDAPTAVADPAAPAQPPAEANPAEVTITLVESGEIVIQCQAAYTAIQDGEVTFTDENSPCFVSDTPVPETNPLDALGDIPVVGDLLSSFPLP